MMPQQKLRCVRQRFEGIMNPLPVAVVCVVILVLTVSIWPEPDGVLASTFRYFVLLTSITVGVLTLSLTVARLTHTNDRAITYAGIGLTAAALAIWAPSYLVRGYPPAASAAQVKIARVAGILVALYFLVWAMLVLWA